MKIQHHFLSTATKKKLNHGNTIMPTYIVVHNTAGGSAMSTYNYLKTHRPDVGYHILIDRDGSHIQCAPFNKRMGHSGLSNWKGIEGMNGHSIGISLSNYGPLIRMTDGSFRSEVGNNPINANQVMIADHPNGSPGRRNIAWETYRGIQIQKLQEMVELIVHEYPIKNIVGHDDIASGRKIDPGPALNVGTLRSCVDLEIEKKYKHKVVNVAANDVLNVRKWGHGSSTKVATLQPGEEIYVLSIPYKQKGHSNWAGISKNGITLIGYVHKDYLTFTEVEKHEPEEAERS